MLLCIRQEERGWASKEENTRTLTKVLRFRTNDLINHDIFYVFKDAFKIKSFTVKNILGFKFI